jgi:hypothetical protein
MYKLVWSSSPQTLEEKVNKLLEEGSYTLVGFPFVFRGSLYQALIKKPSGVADA